MVMNKTLNALLGSIILVSVIVQAVPFLIESFTSNPDFDWGNVSDGDGGTKDYSLVPKIAILVTMFGILLTVIGNTVGFKLGRK